MLSERTCCCRECFTIMRTLRERRVAPGVFSIGKTGRQCRTAYAFFDAGCGETSPLRSAFLRVFVQDARIPELRKKVCICLALPCGVLLPVDERASFEVSRGFCGWISADILPLLKAASGELGGAPLGLALALDTPGIIIFSSVRSLCPRLALNETETCNCPSCPDAAVICAPPCRGGIRVESQVWDIDFDNMDSSVQRRVDRMKQGTFFVTNKGDSDLTAALETSSDGENWAQDTWKIISPESTQAIVAKYYGMIYRVILTAGGAGKAHIAFIGQYYSH